MRQKLLIATIIIGVLVTITTELLSLFSALNRVGLVVAWAVIGVAALPLVRTQRATEWFDAGRWRQQIIDSLKITVASPATMILPALLVGLIGAVTAVALCAPPNTWDSMSYHMGRVANWLQNGTVLHYPTAIERQLRYPPLAEFMILQLQIITGGDRLANLVQVMAFVGCIIGATYLAKQLGANRAGQLLAGVLCATLPMAVIQASGTQNDLVAALWIVCLAVFVLDHNLSQRPVGYLLIGAALGLAVLTKFTGYIYGFPLLLWYFWQLFQQLKWRFIRPAITIALAAGVLNLGHYARTIEMLYHANWQLEVPKTVVEAPASTQNVSTSHLASPSLTDPENSFRLKISVPVRYVNQVWDPQALISNVVRNLGLHLATPSEAANQQVDDAIKQLHTFLRADISDPNTTYPWNAYRGLRFSQHEDDTGNPVHLLLGLTLPFLMIANRSSQRRLHWMYGFVVIACALLFCWVLKWQPWHSRLHLTLFILIAPLLAVLLSRRIGRWGVNGVGLLLTLAVLPWLFWNQPRPMLGQDSVFLLERTSQYFSNRPDLETAYRTVAKLVQNENCNSIGLHMGGNDWEYPWWVLLKTNSAAAPLHIQQVGVTNISQFLPSRLEATPAPCLVLSTRGDEPIIEDMGQRFVRTKIIDPVSVYYDSVYYNSVDYNEETP